MSEFNVEVVEIKELTKHPNADTLSITKVMGDYPVIVRTEDWKPGDKAVYVPIDALVPLTHEHFKFLDDGKGRTHSRIKAKKLRGIFSMGLLVPAPTTAKVGENLQAALGIDKYLPPSEREPGATGPAHAQNRAARRSETRAFENRLLVYHGIAMAIAGTGLGLAGTPFVSTLAVGVLLTCVYVFLVLANRKLNKKPNIPVYDIEGLRKHRYVLQPGEHVVITEKIHGCNARFIHTGHKFHMASRTTFREPANTGKASREGFPSPDVWSLVAKKYDLEAKLKKIPGMVLFGEVYGEVQDLTYGVPAEERVRFAAFDIMDAKTRQYLDPQAFDRVCKALDIPLAPVLYVGPWDHDKAVAMAEGNSTLPGANHVREGIVIKPEHGRTEPGLGRCILKLAGQGYLLRKEKE